MAITSYSTLVTAVADWLDRDDIDEGISTMVGLMEARLYRRLRIRFMESSLSVAISSGVAAQPSDYLGLRTAYIDTTPITKLKPRQLEWIEEHYPTRSSSGVPKFIAPRGDNFEFGPYPDSDYTLTGTYYAKPTALSTSNETNWLTTNAPGLLLFGTLRHSSMYIGHDERQAGWDAEYQRLYSDLVEQYDEERFPNTMTLETRRG